MYVLLSRTQAGPGRTVKQEQEEISRNHVQTVIYLSVKFHYWDAISFHQAEMALGIKPHARCGRPPRPPATTCSSMAALGTSYLGAHFALLDGLVGLESLRFSQTCGSELHRREKQSNARLENVRTNQCKSAAGHPSVRARVCELLQRRRKSIRHSHSQSRSRTRLIKRYGRFSLLLASLGGPDHHKSDGVFPTESKA